MKAKPIKQALVGLVLGLVLVSCGPAYYGVNTGYRYDRPYGYYRRPPVIVTPPPRVVYRNNYRHYRSAPPAYGRRYRSESYSSRGRSYGNRGGRSRGPR